MSDDNNRGGSDLDIFEGLGKKSSGKMPVAPPAPPGSSSHLPTRPMPIDAKRTLLGIPSPATGLTPPPPPSTRPSSESGHPASGSMRANGAHKSDAPPGRGSLPNLAASKSNPPIEAAQRTSATQRVASEPPPRPHNPAPRHHSSHPPPAIVKTRTGKLDHDPYEDDDAADTHVFEKEKVREAQNRAAASPSRPPAPAAGVAYAPTQAFEQVPSTQNAGGSNDRLVERDSLDTLVAPPEQRAASERASARMGTAKTEAAMPAYTQPITQPMPKPIPEPADTASLSAAFGALGETDAASSKGSRSAPPASPIFGGNDGAPRTPLRSVPPPPPMSKTGAMTSPMMPPPPPPPTAAPGMATLPSMQQPMMPPPGSVPPPPLTQPYAAGYASPSAPPSVHPSAPPPSSLPSGYPVGPASLPPVARMDATYTFPKKEPRNNSFILAVLLTVMAIAGAAVFFLMPRTGTIVVNVADAKGAAVSKLEITIDGAKKCESAPCVVRELPAGTHEVKVSAVGYDAPAAKVVSVSSGKDVTTDFQLLAARAPSAGTGFKVAGPAGVKLSVDGKDVGALPQELKTLEPGDHKLHFSGDRYAPLDKTITVAKDEIVDVGNVALKVTKGKATIQLGTPGAKVTLVSGATRKEVPQFPMAIEFDPSEKWELQATKDGMDPYSEKISFDDGLAEKTFNVMLAPKGTAAKAAAEKAAAEKAAAQPPAVAANGNASTAPKAKIIAPSPKESSDEPAEKPKKTSSSGSEVSGDTALKINSLPASSIVLDGKPIGVTPQAHVTVTPGSHTIMFVNSEQSLKKTITVEVKAGETKAAFAKLREE